jgi:hypothetical protein
MKSRAIIVLILLALFPVHAQATPGWCFANVDGQQVCGSTFEESTALLIADMNVRNDRLFAQRAIDDAAAQAAQQAEWRRQAEDQAARDAEMIRISNENAAKNAAEEAARLAAQQGNNSENNSPAPSDSIPESDPTPPSNSTPSSNSPEIIDCALPQYYDHTNCGGPRPSPSSYTQQETPNVQQVVSNTPQESSRISSPQMESQISKPVEAQVDERINSKNEVQPDIKVQESVIVQDATTESEVANTPEKPTIAQEAKKISPIAATKKAPVKKSSTKKASLKTSSTKKAMTVIKISCYKGKSVIVISSTKPLCPTGYSQK